MGQSEGDGLYLAEELLFSGWGEVGKAGRLAKLSFLSKPFPSAQLLSHAQTNSHTDAPDPPHTNI